MKNSQTALLIVDMQNGTVAKAFERGLVIENISKLVSRAREEKVPVIWVQHASDDMKTGSDAWKIVPELEPLKDEIIIHKVHGDSFEGTELQSKLLELQVGRLVVAGAQTEACIRSTIHGAFTRGFDTVLVSDAHTTEDLTDFGLPAPEALVKFTNIYWSFQTGPGKSASVEKSADVQLRKT